MKKALITGITGQDGSYLAEMLLEKNYEVYGIVRRSSSLNRARIDHLQDENFEGRNRLHLIYGDLSDSSSLNHIIRTVAPDEIYNLGAQSHVRVSFDVPEYTGDVTGLGTVRLLEAIREAGLNHCRFYQASSSELYGKVVEVPQKETTPFYPRSPYAAAKAYSFYVTKNYRESYNMFATNGILFNHESPRRGEGFVTRKITLSLARIKYGLQKKLYLGNLDSKRDWGHARDYVKAMWLMLQHETPDDFVIATGEAYSVREFLDVAGEYAGIDWKSVVEIDSKFFRPAEVDLLLGDATKAKTVLGWEPTVSFKQLVKEMVESDMKLVKQQVFGIKPAAPQVYKGEESAFARVV